MHDAERPPLLVFGLDNRACDLAAFMHHTPHIGIDENACAVGMGILQIGFHRALFCAKGTAKVAKAALFAAFNVARNHTYVIAERCSAVL